MLLKEDVIKKQKVLEKLKMIKSIIVKGLFNIIETALIYNIVVVILPIALKKNIEDLRSLSLMIFIGVIFLFILLLLLIVSIIDSKKDEYKKAKNNYIKEASILQLKKKKDQENRNGKEMVSK